MSVFIWIKPVAFGALLQVFVAFQKNIPTTAILPELELDNIETLKELTKQCRVDAERAQAAVQEDVIQIKKKIIEDSWDK